MTDIPKINSKKTGKNLSKFAHTPKSSLGMGDYYGTGIKAKMGRMIEGTGINPVSEKKLGKPPKSLA